VVNSSSKKFKEFKGMERNLKESEVPCHVVNSSYTELTGILKNLKEVNEFSVISKNLRELKGI